MESASLNPKVVSQKRSKQGDLDEFEKSVSEVLPLLRRYYAGQIRNNPGDFKTRGWYPTSLWSQVGNKTAGVLTALGNGAMSTAFLSYKVWQMVT